MRGEALAVLIAASGAPHFAEAQPCCAGASALTPARLGVRETALVGLETRATDIYGSFDPRRHYVSAPKGAREVDLEEDLLGSIRFKHAQASVLIPIDETYRRAGDLSEWGGGVGDAQVAFRYDFLDAGDSKIIPGIGLLGALTFPTGRATESAGTPLATGATGIGAFQAALGASVEQLFGPVLIDLTGSASWRAPRRVEAIHEQDGTLFVTSAAVAYNFEPGPVIAFSASYTAALASSVNGETAHDGGKAVTRLALGAAQILTGQWRAQGSLYSDLPVRFLGQNEPLGVGASFILMRAWH